MYKKIVKGNADQNRKPPFILEQNALCHWKRKSGKMSFSFNVAL